MKTRTKLRLLSWITKKVWCHFYRIRSLSLNLNLYLHIFANLPLAEFSPNHFTAEANDDHEKDQGMHDTVFNIQYRQNVTEVNL